MTLTGIAADIRSGNRRTLGRRLAAVARDAARGPSAGRLLILNLSATAALGVGGPAHGRRLRGGRPGPADHPPPGPAHDRRSGVAASAGRGHRASAVPRPALRRGQAHPRRPHHRLAGPIGRLRPAVPPTPPEPANPSARPTQAFPDGDFPPITVYEVGGLYFVVDGHHRVALARQLGMEYVDADVTAIETSHQLTPRRRRMPADPHRAAPAASRTAAGCWCATRRPRSSSAGRPATGSSSTWWRRTPTS